MHSSEDTRKSGFSKDKPILAWQAALEIYKVDYGSYPKADNIESLYKIIKESNYWDNPSIYDSLGNKFQYFSNGSYYKLWSRQDNIIEGYAEETIVANKDIMQNQSFTTKSHLLSSRIPILNPGTSLSVSKSGNNVILNWTGSGTFF